MRELKLCAAILAMVLAASCGSNSTTAGVTITNPTSNPVSVLENGTQQFNASVSGVSTTTVYWQVCLPAATASVEPTSCTPIPGVTTGTGGLTGYGTITQNGLYTAPNTIPSPDTFVVMAASTVDYTKFAVISVTVATQVQVQMNPTSATMAAGEHFQFAATVTGTSNTNVTWSVDGNDGGNATDGYICPNPAAPQPCTAGEYFAPTPAPGSVTITATSAADTTASASAAVTVEATATPTFTGIEPAAVGEGAAQVDVYMEGSNLLNTTLLEVGSTTLPQSAITWISSSLMRATVPGTLLEQPGNVTLTAVSQNGDTSLATFNLAVNPMRPALVAVSPDTTQQGAGGTSVTLTGGYYVPGRTVATFNGSGAGVTTSYTDSRHLNVSLGAGSLDTPGLYSLFLQNSDAAAVSPPIASMTAKNVAVTPDPSVIGTVPLATVGVGSGPTAAAVDYATGNVLVANTGEGTVSVVNLATNSANPNKIAVGNSPTGIAVDDMLSPPLALVVNNADQTVSTINLSTMSVVGTPLSVSLTTVTPVPLPYSIGINPMTHHAIVTYQNSPYATILDLSTGTPVILTEFGGQFTNYSTGNNPTVAVDERLNWAVVTPGSSGIGVINVVDLGRNAIPGVDSGRQPQMIATASFSPSFTTLGVGINSETHQALFTDPNAATLTSFDIFNDTVNTTQFTLNGVTVSEKGYVAAAASPLTNEAIAVNSGSTATVVELDNGNVLQTVNGLGNNPIAAAIDPATNEAVVVNQGDGTVSILSLGAVRTNQIVEESPEMTFTSASPVTVTVTGSGFGAGAQVRLDQVPVATSTVTSSCTTTTPSVCRQLTATVPASMLGSARRYALDVLNTDATISNVTDFNVVQPVVVGTRPVGVAVDTDRHMAVVTNAGDSTVDLVALSPATPVGNNGGTAGAVGVVGSPITVGATPEGVGVIPRLGLAVTANYNNNSFSVIDETQVAGPKTTGLCTGCVQPIGIGVDSDNGSAVITFTVPTPTLVLGELSVIQVASATAGSAVQVFQLPTGVAIDPTLAYAAVSASQSGDVNILNLATFALVGAGGGVTNFSVPAGIIFDPLNQEFVVANSLANTLVLLNPNTFQTTSISSGIDPTSVDYDFQTSTLVAVNSTSNTMSVLDYDCPPQAGSTACANPAVRAVVGAAAPQPASSVAIGANALGIDSMLGVIVTVDPNNNRVLLVPLPN
jgi:DNA-binding beta-propeller fold protein YncE